MDVRSALIPDELPAVRSLFRAYAAGLGIDLEFQRFDEELAGLPGRYAPPAGGIWIVTEGQEPAGCVALRALADETCEMKRLYVRPEFRGRGLGRLLAKHVLAAAVGLHYRRICLDTLPSMKNAHELYVSLGFAPVEPYYLNPVPGAKFFAKDFGPALS